MFPDGTSSAFVCGESYLHGKNISSFMHCDVAVFSVSLKLILCVLQMYSKQTQESILQSGLEDMYTNMSTETFRSMRRLMPITRTKMEWNVNSVRMVRQVRK